MDAGGGRDAGKGSRRGDDVGRATGREPRIPLPSELRYSAFSVADARAAGVSRGRLRNRTEGRPFHGVRVPELPHDPGKNDHLLGPHGSHDEFEALAQRMRDLDRSYLPIMSEVQAFGGVSAARLCGLPLPLRLLRDTRVHVIVPKGRNPPRARGVSARSVPARFWSVQALRGASIASPELLYCLLARDLSVHELVQLGDALVSEAGNYPGRTLPWALTSRERLVSAVDAWAGCAGAARLRAATGLLRDGVESPWETVTRLVLVESGYPEPAVNFRLMSGVRKIARLDLADLRARIAYEYDGDGHRKDKRQWRLDVTRSREIQGERWSHVRLTVADLEPATSLEAFTSYAHRLRAERLAE